MAMNESEEAFEDLNIFESGEENAKLLAISILLQGDEDVAEFTERLAKFAIEMGQSGSWKDSLTKTAIADWACDRKQRNMYAIIRENILKWGITDSLPDFEKYANMFWADNYGLGKCNDSNKGDTAQNTNPLSKRVGEKFACDGSSWVFTDTSLYKGIIGTMTDERDGHTYRTVKIGKQIWMAENLNYDYHTEITQSICYLNNEENCDTYGRLYTFAAAVDSAGLFSDGGLGCGNTTTSWDVEEFPRGACPEGWHLPSRYEWEKLFIAVGGKVKALRVLRTADYIGTDDYGFNIIKEGGDLENEYSSVFFWTSTNYDNTLAYLIFQMYDDENLLTSPWFQNTDGEDAMSIRCVMD